MGSLSFWVSRVPERLNFILIFFRRWLAWACDAIDFFSVSLNIVNLDAQFHRSTHDLVSDTSLSLLFHFSDFFIRPDDVYYPHVVVPFPRRCKKQSLSRPPPVSLIPSRRRLSLASSLTGLAESGRWSPIFSLSPPFPSAVASSKHTNSSSPFEVSSVSAWEVSGVWPPPPPSKISPSKLVVSLAALCSKDTLSDTYSLPSSTYTLSRTLPGAGSSGLVPVSPPLLPFRDVFFPRAKSSFGLEKRRKLKPRSLASQRHVSSSTRSDRCSRIIGCYLSTLCY